MSNWYTQDADHVLDRLQSSVHGLSSKEARERLERYGPNRLRERPTRNPWLVLLSQFTEVMVIVLLAATVISFLIGETTDAVMILVIVILNAILGFTQEYRAERAMAALQQLSVPTVRVRRDGHVQEIESTALVPATSFCWRAGGRVPADGRLLEAANLRVDEAPLTGESVPVEKAGAALLSDDLPLGDRVNMVFAGTTAVYGRAVAVAVGTGMETELGNIAELLQEVGTEKTPLQRRMAELGKWLAIGALAICALVFVKLSSRTASSARPFSSPSAWPCGGARGPAAVVTIALALGANVWSAARL
jgi:Ca2+-transporting ATPase